MPVICIGPVCIPLNMLLAFLISLAHRYGYLTWFKTEWVTWRFAKRKATQGWRWLTGKEAEPTEEKPGCRNPASLDEQVPSGKARGGVESGEGGATVVRRGQEGEGKDTKEVLEGALQEAKEAEGNEEGSDSKRK